MDDVLWGTAAVLLLTVTASLWRVLHGPHRADRMMAAQLCGTAGVGVLMLLAVVSGRGAILDVAMVLALLAAIAAVAFVKAATPDGAGDPQEDDTGAAP